MFDSPHTATTKISKTVAMESPTSPRTITRLIGVYDADHTIRGELAYWIGARLGRRHCSLCDITHGLVAEKAEWKSCRAELSIPFDTFHRDDQPAVVRAAANNLAPVVVAEFDDGTYELVLRTADLEACAGSPTLLAERLENVTKKQIC